MYDSQTPYFWNTSFCDRFATVPSQNSHFSAFCIWCKAVFSQSPSKNKKITSKVLQRNSIIFTGRQVKSTLLGTLRESNLASGLPFFYSGNMYFVNVMKSDIHATKFPHDLKGSEIFLIHQSSLIHTEHRKIFLIESTKRLNRKHFFFTPSVFHWQAVKDYLNNSVRASVFLQTQTVLTLYGQLFILSLQI